MKIDTNELRLLGEELVNSVGGTLIGPRLKSILFNSNGLLTTQTAHSFGQSLLSLCNDYDSKIETIKKWCGDEENLDLFIETVFTTHKLQLAEKDKEIERYRGTIDNDDLARRALEWK